MNEAEVQEALDNAIQAYCHAYGGAGVLTGYALVAHVSSYEDDGTEMERIVTAQPERQHSHVTDGLLRRGILVLEFLEQKIMGRILEEGE